MTLISLLLQFNTMNVTKTAKCVPNVAVLETNTIIQALLDLVINRGNTCSMHWMNQQWRRINSLQFVSSLPSKHWKVPSHCQLAGMNSPFVHLNRFTVPSVCDNVLHVSRMAQRSICIELVNINELTMVLIINITRSMFAHLNSNVNNLIQLILIALTVY